MYDIGFTTLLIMVVTSRVLSPQYLVWLVGTAALCLAENGPARRATLMFKPAMIVMGCTLVSQVEFPLLFGEVMGGQFWGTTVVAVRNLVLVIACVQAVRALWQAGAREPLDPLEQSPPAAVEGVPAPAPATHTR